MVKLSEETKNNIFSLFTYLNQLQRKEELEQSLLLAEHKNGLIVIPKNKIISWQKKVNLDYAALKSELDILNEKICPISVDQQKVIVKSFVEEMIKLKDREFIQKTFLLYLCYEFKESLTAYEQTLSKSYDTRAVDSQIQLSNRLTGSYHYTASVEIAYDLDQLKDLSISAQKLHSQVRTYIEKWSNLKNWYTDNLLNKELKGFANLKIQSANFDFRVDHEISVSNTLLNSLDAFIPAYLETLIRCIEQTGT